MRGSMESAEMSLAESSPVFTPRYVTLTHGTLAYQWEVPSSQYRGIIESRERYYDAISSSDNEGEEPSSILELLARFLLFLVDDRGARDAVAASSHVECITLLRQRIDTEFLHGSDIHTVAAELPGSLTSRQAVVRAYMATAEYRSQSGSISKLRAALLNRASEKAIKTYAIFGGQGNTQDYISELRSVFMTYTRIVEPLVIIAELALGELVATASPKRQRNFQKGLEILRWLRDPQTTPEKEYLLSAPVSFPLIGLIQFANYAVICRCLDKSPADVADDLLGMAGHSQGIAVAATLATVTTWESFDAALTKALTLLFHIGSAAQEATPQVQIPLATSAEAIKNGEGFPSSMLHVSGFRREQLDQHLNVINSQLLQHQRVAIALVNGPTSFVVSGPVLSLCALTPRLRQFQATPGTDQSKIPFSSRKAEISQRFLPVTAPFHTSHLDAAASQAIRELETLQLLASDIRLPIYHSRTGKDLRNSDIDNLIPDIVRMILTNTGDWPLSTAFQDATHVLDFGPGGLSGVGSLLYRNKQGTGVRVILAGLAEGTSPKFGYRAEIFSSKAVFDSDWGRDYAPKLVRLGTSQMQIETRMTKLLGLPPIMVGAMTPTTASWEFVSAIMNSGYHVELAGGGFHDPAQMTQSIKHLAESVPVGRGICANVIYANPKQVRWQVPLLQKLRSEGMPIDGLTFGAGVPSLEIAKEYIDLGFRYLSLKPGSATAIEQVIAIAQSRKNYPIMLQWTGGRGGGHHSYEDFHDPILQLYASIRRHPNIILVAGSGFGGSQDSYSYLSGAWSLTFGRPPMPFDGILVGSRVMVAKEAKTSLGCKEAIAAAPGIAKETLWEHSYRQVTGGIITVKSEMGEPIHKIATRGVLLWKELDDKVFSIADKNKRREVLQRMRPDLIQRLNRDYQKVWFACDASGDVTELQSMSYAGVLRRLVQLLYVSKESRWIDPSYMRLTVDFVRRAFSRLPRPIPSFQKDFGLKDPPLALPKILSVCPEALNRAIGYMDSRYLMLLCKRTGQKPPTFLIDMDDDFELWFKKDSLWQSEDLAAVVGEDAGRTCILQGPVAAKHSTRVNEPVGEILDSINHNHISSLLKERYGNNEANVHRSSSPSTATRAPPLDHSDWLIRRDGQKTHYYLNKSITHNKVPDIHQWLQEIAGPAGTWVHALITSEAVSQGGRAVPNPIRRALSPSPELHLEVIDSSDPEELAIRVYESGDRCSMTIEKHGDIWVTFYAHETAAKYASSVVFRFSYHPETPLHPVHEMLENRRHNIRDFYHRLWFGLDASLYYGSFPSPSSSPRVNQLHYSHEPQEYVSLNDSQADAQMSINLKLDTPSIILPVNTSEELESVSDDTANYTEGHESSSIDMSDLGDLVFKGGVFTVSASSITAFLECFEGFSTAPRPESTGRVTAPFDYSIVVAWEAMIKAIFPGAIEGDFLNLVHLSNQFRVLNNSEPLADLDRVMTEAHIQAVRNESAGRVVEVCAIVRRNGEPILELVSEFLFRGAYTDFGVCFEKKTGYKMRVEMDTATAVAILKSKSWIKFHKPETDLSGLSLVFELNSVHQLGQDLTYREVRTTGQVYDVNKSTGSHVVIATIEYHCGRATRNPVMDYLKRHGSPIYVVQRQETPLPLGDPDWLHVAIPSTNHAYSRASGDFNPIHVSRTLARYADLPDTITHGMFTSATVRRLVERAAGVTDQVRIRSYKTWFVGMVLPGALLEVQVNHVGMKNGLRAISFQAIDKGSGEKVLLGEADIDQPISAYIFTGQGSQVQGMGMDLYATCPVARSVWDDADKFYLETYGFSISDVVKRNPKQLSVYFGGRRGRKIRQNYMNMMVEGSDRQPKPVFPLITEMTAKHTFQHNDGLLSSTEFVQPALSVVGHAQYRHLESRGLIAPQGLFAGHSLGEYTALSTIGGIMPFETVLRVVFYRGLTMHSAVARDAQGRSNFSLMAVNPGRISKSLTTESLQALFSAIASATGGLLELVNHNVSGQQYVAAGSLTALECLTQIANHMATHPGDFEPGHTESVSMQELVASTAARLVDKPHLIHLERGVATIPLPGIDVPFHSSFLLPRMPAFRRILQQCITNEAVDAKRLVGKYVSNVTGKPFDISHEAVQEVYERTGSEVLGGLLKQWERRSGGILSCKESV